jgi:hypothetical protein
MHQIGVGLHVDYPRCRLLINVTLPKDGSGRDIPGVLCLKIRRLITFGIEKFGTASKFDGQLADLL